MPTTKTGIPYKMLFPTGYQESFVDGGNHIVALLKVEGANCLDFKADMLGYTVWDGTSSRLSRATPELCPYSSYLYCKSLDLAKKGMRPDSSRTTNGSDLYDNWWDFENDASWVVYQAVFEGKTYKVLEDDSISSEQDRYITTIPAFQSREQKITSYQTVTGDGKTLSEPAFLPDYNQVFRATWHQVPEAAVPYSRWATAIGTVNNATFKLGNKTWPIAKVRFDGPRDDLVPYIGANGGRYLDPVLYFTVRGGPDASTWNTFRKADNTYTSVSRKDESGTLHDLNFSTDFSLIFTPG